MTEIQSLLEQVKLGSRKEKLIIALLKKLEKHNDIENEVATKDEITIKCLRNLSYWLYVLGDEKNALSAAKIVCNVTYRTFPKNAHIRNVDVIAKSCQHDCFVLCSYIYSILKDNEQSDAFWAEIVNGAFGEDVSDERKRINKKKWDRNITNGVSFEDWEILRKKSESANYVEGVIYNTFRSLEDLFWMYKMGGSENYPIEKLTKFINEKISYLNENVDRANVKNFTI